MTYTDVRVIVPTAVRLGQYDFFVDSTQLDNDGDGLSLATAKRNITNGMALMQGLSGQTLFIANGTYSEEADRIEESDADIAAGTAGNYNRIMGESVNGVIIEQTMGLRYSPGKGSSVFLEFHNLHWKAPYGLGVTEVERWALDRQFVKFFNCGVRGGALGENSGLAGTEENQLFEDCWFYGLGGRSIMAAFNTRNVIWRRCLFRFDSAWGWLDQGNEEPISIFTMYVNDISGAANLACQNCIFIDSEHFDPPEAQLQGNATANIAANSTASGQTNMFLHGNVYMNIVGFQGGGWRTLGSQTQPLGYLELRDNLYINLSTGVSLALESDGNSLIEQCLFHNITSNCVSDPNANASWSWRVEKSIMQDSGTGLSNGTGLLGDYNNYWNLSSGGDLGTNKITTDPMQNGLSYPIQAAGNLATAAAGSRVGPDITKRIGVSGTLYGDTGWNTVTEDDLWPFPNETAIRDSFREIKPTISIAFTGNPGFEAADRGKVLRNDADSIDVGTIIHYNNTSFLVLVESLDWNVPSVSTGKILTTVGGTGTGTTNGASQQASPSGKRGFCDDTTSIGGNTMSLTYYIVEALGIQESGIY